MLAKLVSRRHRAGVAWSAVGPAAGVGDPRGRTTEIVAAWATYLAAGRARSDGDRLRRRPPHRSGVRCLLTTVHRWRNCRCWCCRRAAGSPGTAFQWVGTDSLTLTLRGLDASETDELLGHLLADDPVTDAQLARAHALGRQPLYAIHFARMLRQQGWSGAIPDSTRSLIAARLDLLAPLERAMVFAGAVADQPFGSGPAGDDAGRRRGAALAMRHLVDKAFLRPRGTSCPSATTSCVKSPTSTWCGQRRLHEAAAAGSNSTPAPHRRRCDAHRPSPRGRRVDARGGRRGHSRTTRRTCSG